MDRVLRLDFLVEIQRHKGLWEKRLLTRAPPMAHLDIRGMMRERFAWMGFVEGCVNTCDVAFGKLGGLAALLRVLLDPFPVDLMEARGGNRQRRGNGSGPRGRRRLDFYVWLFGICFRNFKANFLV
jgi:hypothetical protein